ncbi:hypothetical protein GDO86_002766 [Hymenochirus boettgeri]|uniref:Fibronectin type-III domain-containing protein n=1 Tax=Hymenochirus boettgeri TaxID=247094 RepID=A0A8T2JYH4_9PIPI|nr:hypothetical protein GDO86_002766 [Hymenochirus boettgeri]
MNSVNFKNILEWDPPSAAGDVPYMYKAGCKLKRKEKKGKENFTNICYTNATNCDFSAINYKAVLHVRAQLNNNVSDWVTTEFYPYAQTIITAPKVNVFSRAGYLDVSFSGPVTSDHQPVKDIYGLLNYKVVYWKESDPSDVTEINTEQNFETLNDLSKWTTYCIKVQAYAPEYGNDGQFSKVICETTTEDGIIPVWKIALTFILSSCLSVGVIFLREPFYGSPHLPSQPDKDWEGTCETLTFVSEESELV